MRLNSNLVQMNLALIGDLHFKKENVADVTIFQREVLTYLNKLKPDAIIILGDSLDRHETSHYLPLKLLTNFFDSLCQIAVVYVLIGNHDRPTNDHFLTDDHFFTAFKYWPRLHIIDVGLLTSINEVKIAFIPYVPAGRFEEAYQLITQGKEVDLIFAHQEFKNAELNCCTKHQTLSRKSVPSQSINSTKILSIHGDVWPCNRPPVFSGHIHKRQELSNVFYVGTPLQHDFGDTDYENKGIAVLKLSNDAFELDYIKLNVPKKMTLIAKLSDLAGLKFDGHDRIRLTIYYSNDNERKTIEQSKDYIRLKGQGVKFQLVPVKGKATSHVFPERRNFLDQLWANLNEDADRKYLQNLFATNLLN